MGVKPLFYYPTADGVLFGSEPKTILAHPTVEPRVNKDGFRELLVLAKNPESTIYTGMCEVRPGQVVRVNRNGLAKRRYWMLTAHEHNDSNGRKMPIPRRKIRPTRKLFAPRFWRTRSHPATSLLNRKVVKDLLARPLGTTSSIPERAGLERARSISACGEGLRRRAGPVVNPFVSRDPQATESEDIASKFLLPLISLFSGRPGSVGPRS
jgi:hypothetical protein